MEVSIWESHIYEFYKYDNILDIYIYSGFSVTTLDCILEEVSSDPSAAEDFGMEAVKRFAN